MNIAQFTAVLLGSFTLSATLSHAQAVLEFQDVKNFKITGPKTADYEGGSWNVELNDGSITFLGCGAGPSFEGGQGFIPGSLIYISPRLGCPSGTTALITVGEVNEGIRDQGGYFAIAQPVPAIQVEPFQTGLVRLIGAPPSDLERPFGNFGWSDRSLVLFYDLVNDPINGIGYEQTIYEFSKPYAASDLNKHRDEIVQGSYLFSFPALGSDASKPRSFNVNAPHRLMVEAYPPRGGRDVVSGGVSVGNDFRLTNDDRWNNGVMEFDPRVVFDFEWQGFNGQTFFGGDRVFFSVRNRETDKIVFPPIPEVPAPFPPNPELPQLIASSTLGIATGYELGPNFFTPNQELRVELQFSRNLVSGNSVDTSTRFFRWDIDLIDTYDGFQQTGFPAGSSEALVGSADDYDGDGFSNLEEFGFQTDVLDPASVPNPTPTIDPFTEHCELVIPKRPGIGSRLSYFVEYSLDLVTWTRIGLDDPNWFLVTDDESEISVFSRRPANINPCFTRVRFTQN